MLHRIARLTAELKECTTENEELITKAEGAQKTLDRLLALIQSKDHTIANLKQKQGETEEKLSKELDCELLLFYPNFELCFSQPCGNITLENNWR